MKIFTYLFALFLIFLGISFSLLNSSEVTINYFIGSATLPLAILIILSLVLGLALGFFFSFISILRHKARLFHLKRKLDLLEKASSSV